MREAPEGSMCKDSMQDAYSQTVFYGGAKMAVITHSYASRMLKSAICLTKLWVKG